MNKNPPPASLYDNYSKIIEPAKKIEAIKLIKDAISEVDFNQIEQAENKIRKALALIGDS